MARLTPFPMLSKALLLWALLLGPAFCMGGQVKHACDCREEAALQCQHEDACSDDPCSSVARQEDVDAQNELELDLDLAKIPVNWIPALGLAAPLGTTTVREMENPQNAWIRGSPAPSDRSHLPYAECDRPLRI